MDDIDQAFLDDLDRSIEIDFLGSDNHHSLVPTSTATVWSSAAATRSRHQMDNIEQILEACTERLQHHPDDIDTYKLRGSLLLRKHSYEAALPDFTAVLAHDSCHIDCLYSRGVCWSHLSRFISPSP
jgi:hypothetical protein